MMSRKEERWPRSCSSTGSPRNRSRRIPSRRNGCPIFPAECEPASLPEIADRLYRLRSGPDGIDTRMAFYGDLFLRGGQQGVEPEELSGPELALAEELAMEWTARATSRSADEKSRRAASQELALLQQTAGEEQGARAAARSAINGLARIRWFAPFGMGFASRFVMRSLTQVTRYLSDDSLREQALARVHALLTPGTQVMIGHSLGSVVAFEAAQMFDRSAPAAHHHRVPIGPAYRRVRTGPSAAPSVPAGGSSLGEHCRPQRHRGRRARPHPAVRPDRSTWGGVGGWLHGGERHKTTPS